MNVIRKYRLRTGCQNSKFPAIRYSVYRNWYCITGRKEFQITLFCIPVIWYTVLFCYMVYRTFGIRYTVATNCRNYWIPKLMKEPVLPEFPGFYRYKQLMQSDRNSSKSGTFHKPTTYKPHFYTCYEQIVIFVRHEYGRDH